MNAKTPVEPTPITTKKSTKAQQEPEPVEPTTPESVKKPKLTYAQRLALLPPEEAAAIRAKANAASKASKARAKGYESPEVAKAVRLNAMLARNQEKTQVLAEEREKIEAELHAIAEAAKESAIVEESAPVAGVVHNENS